MSYLKKLPLALLPLLTMLLASPANLWSAETVLQAETIVRFLERDTASETDALVIPAYEYLRVDMAGDTLSFHANGWGRFDLSDSDFFDDQRAGELLHGYLEYRPAGSALTARIGRQALHAGVASESIDGLYLDMPLTARFSVTLFGGQPVALETTAGRDGDALYGGRIAIRSAQGRLGASYLLIENDGVEAEELAGLDYGVALGRLFIGGISSYNLISEDFAEHSFDALFTSGETRYRAFYQLFSFADYFTTGANSANPFKVLALTSEELSSYGLELTRRSGEALEIGCKLTRNDYDNKEASHYGALLVNWSGDGATSYGGEIGLSKGENGRNDMALARLYLLKELADKTLLDRIGLDLLYATYDEPIFGEKSSLFASLSANRSLGQRLQLKLSADYESNPYYDSDVRGLVSLVYQTAAE